MDISSTATLLSQVSADQAHATKVNVMIKDQMEANGQQALKLIESTTPRPVDPSNPVGQNIDTYA
ncbi:MAG: putative motility protein [Oceanospirillales bacterium]|nr:putative motility protein [Oceanospirillales bacterium]